MANLVENPYPIITNADGDPLEDGYVFIGEPGLSPITNPLQAYWDSDLTVPATNIRTKGGYPSRSGTPGRLYTATNYSILVQDRNKRTIYTQLDSVDYANSASGNLISSVETIADLRDILPLEPYVQVSLAGSAIVGDGLVGALYYWEPTSGATDNGVSIIEPTASVGNGRWLWISNNAPIESENISASGTLSLDFINKIFLVNTALAITLAVPDGDFQGQEIQLSNDGVSTLEITGTGINTGTFVASEILLTWVGTQWSLTWKSKFASNTANRGYFEASLSNYDTDDATAMQKGSVFENNGELISIEVDTVPTGYGGIAASTAFYIYYDESTGVLIYSETVPSWSDDLQGWYDGTDRALFAMYKDSGGTLYQSKREMINNSVEQVRFSKYHKVTGATEDQIYDVLLQWMPTAGDMLAVSGQIVVGVIEYSAYMIFKSSANSFNVYSWTTNGALGTLTITTGDASVVPYFEVMSNYAPINYA